MCGMNVDADMVLTTFASFALLRSKILARSKLSPALWVIWSIDNLVTAICVVTTSSWEDGGFNFCVEAVVTFLVMILAVRYGQVRFSRSDTGDLLSCLSGAFGWVVATALGFPWVGEISLLTLGAMGTISFYRSLGRDPQSEDLFVWALFLVADCASIGSFQGDSLTGLGFLGIELSASLGAVLVGVACGFVAFLGRSKRCYFRGYSPPGEQPFEEFVSKELSRSYWLRCMLISHVLADA